jgi:vitamin B12 transporter
MPWKFKCLRAATLAGASVLWLAAVIPAQAQTEPQKNTETAAEADAKDRKATEKPAGTAAEIVNAQGEVERVLITGRLEEMLPQQLSQFGTRVDVVTAVQIQDGGYLDIAQSLQNLVPGLFIANQNGPFDYVDISLQGSRIGDVLWLLDGVRLNNRLYAGTTPLDMLPSAMVERIEVLEGAQSLFYGTQAIAGAINIVTKEFTEDPNGHVSVGFDTNGGRHVDGYFSDTLGGHRFAIFGSADKSDGFQPFPDEDYQPSATDRNRAYEVLTLGGKYAYEFTNALRFSASYVHSDVKLDFARATAARPTAGAAGPAAIAFNEGREDTLAAKVDYTPSDEFGFFVKGYYHWWYRYFTRFDHDVANPEPGSLREISNHEFWGFTDYGVNALARHAPTGLGFEFYGGYDFQSYEGNDAVLYIEEQSETVHAVFGEVATTMDLFPNARISAGFRHNMPDFGESATVWNVGARWDITPGLFVRGSVGTAFRLPTAEELFANDPPDMPEWIGNPNLHPESSTNANLGIGGSFGMNAINWEVIGFWRDVEDFIDVVFDDALAADVFANLPGTMEVRGVEFALSANLGQEFSGRLSFTFNSAELEGEQVDRIPEQYGNLTLDYHPMTMPFGLTLAARYVGDVYRSLPSGLGRVGYGDYFVIDLGGRVFFDAERHHRIDLNVHNLFDEDYSARVDRVFSDTGTPYVLNSLGWSRTFMMRYTYSFF